MGILKKIFGEPIPEKLPTTVTDANFDEIVMQSEIPVVVDIWGQGCPPCKRLEPIMMKLAGKYEDDVLVCEMNAAQNPRTTVRFNVRSTPTLLYFRAHGHLIERVNGFRGRLYHEEVINTDLLRLKAAGV